MGVVLPSILVRTQNEIEEKLTFLRGLVDTVQIDIVDGKFAGPATWPYAEGGLEAFIASGTHFHDWGNFRFEVDLMVENPAEHVGAWINAGAQRIIVHIEATHNLENLIDCIEGKFGRDKTFAPELLSLGVAVGVATDLSPLEPYLSKIDYLQFMGIATVGKQGVPFDERVIGKIQEFATQHPKFPTQVDGGVSLQNAPALLAAGVDRLAVGSAVWKSGDIPGTIQKFEELAEHYGRYQ